MASGWLPRPWTILSLFSWSKILFDLSGDTLSQTQLYIVHATLVTGSMGNKCVDEWLTFKEPLDIFLKRMTWSTITAYVSDTTEVTPSKRDGSGLPERTPSWKSFPPDTPQSRRESHASCAGCRHYSPSRLPLLLKLICTPVQCVILLAVGLLMTDSHSLRTSGLPVAWLCMDALQWQD